MALPLRDRPHFHVEGGGQSETYTSPRLVITGLPPARIRAAHAARLGQALQAAVAAGREAIARREDGLAEGAKGFYLEFDFPAAERAAVEALDLPPFEWTPMLAFRSWRGVSDEREASGLSGDLQTGSG
jgi:hypothetical protein